MSWSGGAVWKPEIEKAEQESGSARRSLSLAPCPPLVVLGSLPTYNNTVEEMDSD